MSVDPSDVGAIDDLCAALERGPLAGRVPLMGDPRWALGLVDGKDKSCRIYALRESERLTGLATFLIHPSSVQLALGEVTLLARPVRRLNALAPPVAVAGDRQQEKNRLGALFALVRQELGRDEVIFLESVAEGTALFDLVAGPRTGIPGVHAVRNGNLYDHRYATVTDSFDAYLGQLGARTRADLRGNRKRFLAHVGQSYRTRCFRT
ncbi:MAG: hypothetical protein ACRET4_16625, partial [Steroidobacteraceae bacterium]